MPAPQIIQLGVAAKTFAEPWYALDDFGLAQRWTGRKHLRFLADVSVDGTPDVVGFGDEGSGRRTTAATAGSSKPSWRARVRVER